MDKPKGGNQYVEDPRQADFIANYFNPKSKTYSNSYQSAIEAGYSVEYAKTLKSRVNWLSDTVNTITKDKLVSKAKNNLDKLLDSADEKIQADITKFVAKTDKDFSDKVDLTSNGESITLPTIRIIDERRNPDTK
jgi:phage terminase small subunit